MSRLWVVLVPALLLTLILDFGGTHWFASAQNIYHNPASPYGAMLAQRLTATAFLGNLFFLQGILTPTFGSNEPLWSLSYEFWFYLFFPLLLTAVLPAGKLGMRLASGVLFCALLVFCGWSISAYFALWGCGALAALLPLRLSAPAVRVLLPVTLLTMVAAMFAILKAHLSRFAGEMLLGFVFMGVLWTILHLRGATVGRVYRTLAQASSKISYTLYLVHFPLLVFLSAALYPVWSLRRLSISSLASLFAIDLAVLAAAWGMYVCFERNTGRVRSLFGSLAGRPVAQPPPALSPVAGGELSRSSLSRT
jgi:peptidoglycan/LPS O-acetylase OafA/YrhL